MDDIQTDRYTLSDNGGMFCIRFGLLYEAIGLDQSEVEQLNKATGEWLDEQMAAADMQRRAGEKIGGHQLTGEAKAIEIMAVKRHKSAGFQIGPNDTWENSSDESKEYFRKLGRGDIKALTDAGAEILFMDDPIHIGTDDDAILDKLRAVGIEPDDTPTVTENLVKAFDEQKRNIMDETADRNIAPNVISAALKNAPIDADDFIFAPGPLQNLTIDGAGGKRLTVREDGPGHIALNAHPYHRDQFAKLITWGIEWLDRHPTPVEPWLVFWDRIPASEHNDESAARDAIANAGPNRSAIAIKKINYTPGEGLTNGQ